MIDQSTLASLPKTLNSTNRPSFPDHRQALVDADRRAGRLDVDVAAVAAGEALDDGGGVLLVGSIVTCAPNAFASARPLGHEVDDDQLLRRLQVRDLHHRQPERAGAGDDDDIVELDVAAVDGVDRARHRLDQRGVLEREALGNLVHARGRRDAHEVGHAAVGDDALEAEDVVHLAHPVLAAGAVAAAVARNDLLGDHALADATPKCSAAPGPSSATRPKNSWPGITGA
jgi:hypothetical protein